MSSKQVWSYQPEALEQHPASLRMLLEKHVGLIDSRAMGHDTHWHDVAMAPHGRRVLPADLEAMMGECLALAHDRTIVITGKKKPPLCGKFAAVAPPQAATTQTHFTEYFLRNESKWCELFIQGAPFQMVSSDRHYKMMKRVKEDGDQVSGVCSRGGHRPRSEATRALYSPT